MSNLVGEKVEQGGAGPLRGLVFAGQGAQGIRGTTDAISLDRVRRADPQNGPWVRTVEARGGESVRPDAAVEVDRVRIRVAHDLDRQRAGGIAHRIHHDAAEPGRRPALVVRPRAEGCRSRLPHLGGQLFLKPARRRRRKANHRGHGESERDQWAVSGCRWSPGAA